MSHYSLGVSVPDRHFSRVRYAHVGDLFAIKLLVLIEDCDTVNAEGNRRQLALLLYFRVLSR